MIVYLHSWWGCACVLFTCVTLSLFSVLYHTVSQIHLPSSSHLGDISLSLIKNATSPTCCKLVKCWQHRPLSQASCSRTSFNQTLLFPLWCCDICGKGALCDRPMHGCHECDWDACESCMDQNEGGTVKWGCILELAMSCHRLLED